MNIALGRPVERTAGLWWLGLEIDGETLYALDCEIMRELRRLARTRKGYWLREGSAVALVKAPTARKIARARGVGWKSEGAFAHRLVSARVNHLATTGQIRRESRITPTGRAVPGYIVTMPDVRLTPGDRRFLAALLVRWDVPETAAAGAGRGASNGIRRTDSGAINE